MKASGVQTLYIEPGSSWENGYIESFSGKFRDEFLNPGIFDTLLEAKVLAERWKKEYNTFRPHSSLSYKPPAPEAILGPVLSQEVVQLLGASHDPITINMCSGNTIKKRNNAR